MKREMLIKLFYIGEKGFTLMELLVIMAIVGILAAIAIFGMGGYIGRSQWRYWLLPPSQTKSNTILNSRLGRGAL